MTEFAREYGNALYSLCVDEKIAQTVLEELRTLKTCFAQDADFVRLLSNMSLTKAERLGILDSALREQVHPYVLNFLKILCERAALGQFRECIKVFNDNYNLDNKIVEATIVTSEELSDEQREQLLNRLTSLKGQKVMLIEKLDANVKGGVLLEMEGQRYDDTLRKRLMSIRNAMLDDSGIERVDGKW